MKEELTTKMHSELAVPRDTSIKHRCWSALTMIQNIKDADDVENWADVYNVSTTDVIKYSVEYYKLTK